MNIITLNLNKQYFNIIIIIKLTISIILINKMKLYKNIYYN